MLDTHAVARSLTAADFTPAQADALTDALRLVVEQGDHVTSDQFKAGPGRECVPRCAPKSRRCARRRSVAATLKSFPIIATRPVTNSGRGQRRTCKCAYS